MASIGLGCAGCGSPFVAHGVTKVGSDFSPPAKATWSTPNCQVEKAKRITDVMSYTLIDYNGAPGLLWRARDGGGDAYVVTNRWTDEKGDHYFRWITGSAMISVSGGFDAILPKDPGAATLVVYDKSDVTAEGGVTKPAMTPVGTCAMVLGK